MREAVKREEGLLRAETLRLFRKEAPVGVLGPGLRAVIWVQGCPFACPNCIVPESWDAGGGEVVALEELADWVTAQPEIEGVTYSGGEPMAQAEALARLTDRIRRKRDLGVVCYTGYTWEHLQGRGTPEQHALLARIDLLIDGVYLEGRHGDLLWRGSANQRLLPLSPRYRDRIEALTSETDRSAGVEFFMNPAGVLGFAGVPTQPGFRTELETRLAGMGIRLQPREEVEP